MTPEFERWLDKERDKERQELVDEVADSVNSIFRFASSNRERNCYYCMLYSRDEDKCVPMKMKPPTFVLVHGCWQFHHIKDIPY